MRRRPMRLALVVTLVAWCAHPLTASEQSPGRQVVPMTLVDSTTLDLGFGTCQWLYPLDGAGEALAKEPAYKSAKIVRYAARFGDSEDDTFSFVIDEGGGTGSGYDTLYVDGDNDNRIDAATERFSFSMSTTSKEVPLRIKLLVTAGGRTSPYVVNFTAFPYSDENHPVEKIHANLRNSAYYVGEARFDGKPVKIAIADLDGNGLFNDPEMSLFDGDRLFIDRNGDGDFKNDETSGGNNGYPYGRFTKVGGVWHSIIASPGGSRIEIRTAAPSLGTLRAPPMISFADLRSEAQPCQVEFKENRAEALVGSYSVRTVTLMAKDEAGRTWETSGRFPEGARPEVTIAEKGTARLSVGLPLRIEPKVSRGSRSGALEVELGIKGSAGETYQWRDSPAAEKPGFEVLDEEGEVIYSATFKYG